MADGSIKIDTKIDGSDVKSQINKLKSSITSSFATMRDIMQGPVAAVNLLTDAFGGLYKATVGQASIIEDMTAAFTPMVGGSENAAKMIKALNKEAAATPYTLQDIGGVAKQLLPVLGNDIEKVTKTFRMLGDTAGGNAQKLDSITRGYMKTMLKGKVDMESLNMIAEAGVPIYKELAASMGVSTARMMELSDQGKITAQDLTKSFERMTSRGGIFYEGMIIASKTLSGVMSTTRDSIAAAGRVLGDKLLPYIKKAALEVTRLLNKFVDWAEKGDNLKNALTILGYALSALAAGFVAYKISAIASVVASGGLTTAIRAMTVAMAANPIGALAVLISAVLIPALIWLWNNFDIALKKIKEFNKEIKVIAVLSPIITAIAALPFAIMYVIKNWEDLVNSFKIGALEVKIIITELTQTIVDEFFNALLKIAQMNAMLPGVSRLWVGVANSLKSYKKSFDDATGNTVSRARERIKAIEAESAARKKQIAEEKKAAEITGGGAITPAAAAPEAAKAATQEALDKEEESLKKLGEMRTEYQEKITNVNNAVADGIITEEEGKKEIIRLTEEQIKMMNELGYSSDAFYKGSKKGGDLAAKEMQDKLAGLKRSLPMAAAVGLGLPEEMANGIEEGLHTLTSTIKKVVGKIAAAFQTAWAVFEGIVNVMSFLSDFNPADLLSKLQGFLDGVTQFFMQDLGGLPVFFKSGIEIIEKFLDGMIQNLPMIVETIGNVINEIAQMIITKAPVLIQKFLEVVSKIAIALAENAPALFKAFISVIVSVMENLTEIAPPLIKAVMQAINEMIKYLGENAGVILVAFVNLFFAVFNSLVEQLPYTLEALAQALPDILIAIIFEAVPEIIKNLPRFIALLVVALIKTLYLVPKALVLACVDIGKSLWSGIVKGFTDYIPRAWGGIVAGFNWFIDKIKSFFGIHSPSTVFARFGVDLILGLVQGMLKMITAPLGAIKTIFTGVFSFFEEAFTIFFSFGSSIVSKIIEGLLSIGSTVFDTIKGLFNTLSDLLSIFFSFGSSIVSKIIEGLLSIGSIVFDTIKGLFNTLSDLFSIFYNFGSSIISKIIEGLLSIGSIVFDTIKGLFNTLSDLFSIFYNFGSSIISKIIEGFNSIAGSLKDTLINFFSPIIESIKGMFSSMFDWAKDQAKGIGDVIGGGGGGGGGGIIGGVVDIAKKIPKPRIPHFASGSLDTQAGLSVVGEDGTELLEMPAHARVYTAKETKDMLSGRGAASILNGLTNRMTPQVAAPIAAGAGMSSLTINNEMRGNIIVDGKTLARIVFNNIDKSIKSAYGY